MSRRFLLITFVTFLVCVGIGILAAYNFGADPLHPRSRGTWALGLIAALYVSIRIAMVVGKFLDAREHPIGVDFWTGLIPIFGKKDHAIDRRLAERRARVEAAQKRANESNDENKEPDDE